MSWTTTERLFEKSCLPPSVVPFMPRKEAQRQRPCLSDTQNWAPGAVLPSRPYPPDLPKSECKVNTNRISAKPVCIYQGRLTPMINNSKVSEAPRNKSSFLTEATVQTFSGVMPAPQSGARFFQPIFLHQPADEGRVKAWRVLYQLS